MSYEILEKIKSPGDVKALDEEQLGELCEEIRGKLIDIVSVNGGHLSSNLGVVELTVALHRVFDCPSDSIVFDVGHQSYTHKMLTGRYDRIDTIRREGGLSGFPKRSESDCDAFNAGHASEIRLTPVSRLIYKRLNVALDLVHNNVIILV